MEAANGVRFAPTFLGCFNTNLGILTYCNAGRSSRRVSRCEERVCSRARRGPTGTFHHVTYEPAVLAFESQDKLLLVTKGVTESRRGTAEFGVKRIERVLEHSNGDSASQICDTVLREAYDFGNNPLVARVRLSVLTPPAQQRGSDRRSPRTPLNSEYYAAPRKKPQNLSHYATLRSR